MAERYQLVQTPERLELHDTMQPKVGPVYVDFIQGKARHRLQFGGGKGQAIAKAVGLHKWPQPNVVDATAGLGREGFVLASLGCHVTLLERSPIVYQLLKDGLQRAQAANDPAIVQISQRLTLYQTDAFIWLEALKPSAYPEVIYLDPMFPERRKTALVQKEMRFFHEIVGNDEDSGNLVELAQSRVKQRVVVKRPCHAPFLGTHPPAFVIGGKTSIRYDVYLPKTTA